MKSPKSDKINVKFNSGSWGIEVEFSNNLDQSVFRTVKKMILDDKFVQLHLPDGVCESFPVGHVRKVLSMKTNSSLESNGEDVSADELY